MTKNLELWQLIEETQGKIAAEVRRMLNEPPIAPHNFTPANQRRRIESMIECAADATNDEERHTAWMRKHESEGWVFGDTFDAALKTHPYLVPWEQLPKAQQCKARIFDIMAKLGKSLESLSNAPVENPAVLVDQDKETQIPPDIA